jgi:23S rRNA pseudouridine955/2504/2580 synthase
LTISPGFGKGFMEKELIAGINDSGRRLDRILRRALPDMPLSLIHRLLRTGRVTVNGVPGRAADRIAADSRICLREEAAPPGYGEGNPPPKKEAGLGPSDKLPPGLCIVREGSGLLIVNKPSGIAVHSQDRRGITGSGKTRPGPACLDAQVRAYLRDKLPPSLSFRPGPLHRLDQVSSGIIVFSTSLAGARAFSALMRERRLRKTYLALADGRIEGEEIWEEALFRDTARGKTLIVTGEQPEVPPDRTRVKPARMVKPARTRVFPLAVHPP